MATADDFALRRTIEPYRVLLVVLIAVTLLGIFDELKTRDINWIGAILFVWVLPVPLLYSDTRYRIFWENGAIKQVAANKDVTIIKPLDIKRIELERSDIQTLFAMRRPSRRIAIYANGPDGHKWIDVSLKHFAADDIRRLMQAIHERRPDLSIPKNWV